MMCRLGDPDQVHATDQVLKKVCIDRRLLVCLLKTYHYKTHCIWR